ncbi:MAG TPA: hypothetical protein VFZ28_10770 [Burkholderiaceae bacterium]|nr:hypothetical protein [Burkholderiaceae bacterium]
MFRFIVRSGAPLAWCVSALAAGPQAAATRPDPLNPAASAPLASYESVFKDYRHVGDVQRIPWKQANETVGRIGGWRAYAREAQVPEAAASASGPRPADAASTAPDRGDQKR